MSNAPAVTATAARVGRGLAVHALHVGLRDIGQLATTCGAESNATHHARVMPTTDAVTCRRCAK